MKRITNPGGTPRLFVKIAILLLFIVVDTIGSENVYYETGDTLNGKRSGKWEGFYKTGKIAYTGSYFEGKKNGDWKVWYETGNLQEEASYLLDKFCGESKFFYETGVLAQRCFLVNSIMQGYFESYYEDGQVKERGILKDGLKAGEWKHWFPNGQLYETWTCSPENPGQVVGELVRFHDNGKISVRAKYADDVIVQYGILHGAYIAYYQNGSIKIDALFNNGFLSGDFRYYYPSKSKSIQGSYSLKVPGIPDGLWTIFYENGEKCCEGHFTMGKEEGLWRAWFPNNVLKWEGTFDDGEKAGVWKFWDAEGNQVKDSNCIDFFIFIQEVYKEEFPRLRTYRAVSNTVGPLKTEIPE